MFLFITRRNRKIYFTKDNTAFYKSKKNNVDVTYMFKKTKNGLELKKKYLKTGGGEFKNYIERHSIESLISFALLYNKNISEENKRKLEEINEEITTYLELDNKQEQKKPEDYDMDKLEGLKDELSELFVKLKMITTYISSSENNIKLITFLVQNTNISEQDASELEKIKEKIETYKELDEKSDTPEPEEYMNNLKDLEQLHIKIIRLNNKLRQQERKATNQDDNQEDEATTEKDYNQQVEAATEKKENDIKTAEKIGEEASQAPVVQRVRHFNLKPEQHTTPEQLHVRNYNQGTVRKTTPKKPVQQINATTFKLTEPSRRTTLSKVKLEIENITRNIDTMYERVLDAYELQEKIKEINQRIDKFLSSNSQNSRGAESRVRRESVDLRNTEVELNQKINSYKEELKTLKRYLTCLRNNLNQLY